MCSSIMIIINDGEHFLFISFTNSYEITLNNF